MTDKIEGTVTSLFRYPVSSLAGEEISTASLTTSGLDGDRQYGLFDRETNTHIYPARDSRWNAAPQLHARMSGRLEVSTDGQSWLAADDPEMLEGLETIFNRSVDLRQYGPDHARRYQLAPLHLLSLQAMDHLRRVLPESAIDHRRFRPNIVVDLQGVDGDVPEYALIGQQFSIGGLKLRGTTPCARCGFTTLEMGNLPEDPAVLRTLVRRYERNFGIYCEVLEEGEIHKGDRLIGERSEPSIGPVLIVGGGQAGAMAARALRRLGYAGVIRLFGGERHTPYERPPLSKRLKAATTQEHEPILSAEDAETLKISLHLGSMVEAIDLAGRRIETSDGTEIGYGSLILATGGTARHVPDLARGHGRVHVLRTVEDAVRLSEVLAAGTKIFVFGGGWIGMEVAAMASEAGASVTLFARSKRLAPRILPASVSEKLEALHRERGTVLRFGVDPKFKETRDGVTCSIGREVLHADHIVIAIGMVPLDGIARRAGLDCRNGIIVDADGATSMPNVYAIGDVAQQPIGRIESWQNANVQAERVARTLLKHERVPEAPLYFWSDQFGRRLQIAGMPNPNAPILATSEDYWEFENFAIGIDKPEKIRRFSRRLADTQMTSAAAATSLDIPRDEHYLCLAGDVKEGTLLRIDHEAGGALAITRQNGIVYASADRCPHSVASLSEGFVEDGHIVCPLHFAEFRLSDGAPRNAPPGCGRLLVHSVTEKEGRLYVSLPSPRGSF
ncbi:FAD-dependent oxidoreductase [Ensifer adhaerens]|uniref:FAD-dependent oxidoreductase n=1 Tax=Ensifer adhaerens TaxID=106592 RepID=A0A9Q8YFL6_ENSAD|nr:FAD-dependent oxidoreductase [Ensifer adhaerens]USJ27646.1 FAD-dependent oxidoreductase [Ensifer adhaerens]